MLSKLVRGGIAGAIAFVVANIVSNLLFFQLGKSVLFDPDVQSEKVMAVLFEMEPLPLMFTNGLLIYVNCCGYRYCARISLYIHRTMLAQKYNQTRCRILCNFMDTDGVIFRVSHAV